MPPFSDLDQAINKLLSVSNPIPKQALSKFLLGSPLIFFGAKHIR